MISLAVSGHRSGHHSFYRRDTDSRPLILSEFLFFWAHDQTEAGSGMAATERANVAAIATATRATTTWATEAQIETHMSFVLALLNA